MAAGRPRPGPRRAAGSEPIIAPNIQLAGNFTTRSNSAAASRGRDQRGQFERRGDRGSDAPAATDGASPVSASSIGKRRGENDHPHGLHHGDRRHVGALLDRQHGDLRQRAGASRQERRGAVPAMEALQVEAGAEGRAEGRERQQARWSGDRRRHAPAAAATPASPAKSRAAPAPSGSASPAPPAAARRSRQSPPRSWRRRSARPEAAPTGTARRPRRRSPASRAP